MHYNINFQSHIEMGLKWLLWRIYMFSKYNFKKMCFSIFNFFMITEGVTHRILYVIAQFLLYEYCTNIIA